MKFALFSKFMRGLSIEEVASKTRALGLSAVEFPVRGEFECNLENVGKTLPSVAKRLHTAGVEIVVVASDIKEADRKEGDYLYEACREAGAPFVRPGYWIVDGLDYWEKYDRAVRQLGFLQKLSEKHGVKTLVHVHSGKILSANCAMTYMLVKDCDPRYVGVYFDPAHIAADGEDYEMGLGIIRKYLSGVAIKNCCYVQTGESSVNGTQWGLRWVSARTGLVPWGKVLQLLKDIDYNGFFCFHAEYTEHESTEDLVADDVRYIKGILSRI